LTKSRGGDWLKSVLILNPDDIDHELRKLASSAYSPVVAQWLENVVKAYLLNMEGMGKDENFRVYDPASLKLLPGEPPPLEKLPDEAKAAFERGETLYWFDPIQVYKRKTWKGIKTIAVWMNSFPRDLTFQDAGRQAEAWASSVNFKP
jgi:hypothetical protein